MFFVLNRVDGALGPGVSNLNQLYRQCFPHLRVNQRLLTIESHIEFLTGILDAK